MIKTQKTSVIFSFLGLWLTSYLSTDNQTILGLVLIFSFGILHGANDLVLINQIEQNKKHTYLRIIGAYIILILLSVLFFINIPLIALVFFILVSAYHFGEQNWQEILKGYNKYVGIFFQFNYGFLILTTLFYLNSIEVKKIILEIAKININENFFLLLLSLSFLLYIIIALKIIKNKTNLKTKIIEQTFYILVLSLIFKVSSLIWGFAIYFIFWHSIPSLHDQIKFLYGSYTFSNFKKYFKSAFVYWLISLIGVFILYTISKDMIIFDALFFSFLASITFPHFIIILKMYQK